MSVLDDLLVVRLAVAALSLLGACDKGATTRLYTDDELAKVEANASRRVAPGWESVLDVSILSLRPMLSELEHIRDEPNTSNATSRAIAELHDVRRLAKGHTSLNCLFVIESGQRAIADTLDTIVRRPDIQNTDLDAVALAVDTALATYPRLGSAFDGDFGWLRGSILYRPSMPSSGAHDARDERALTLAVIEELDSRLASACPPAASISTCHRKLPTKQEQIRLAGTFIDAASEEIRRSNTAARVRLQAELTRAVTLNQLGAYGSYVARSAIEVARLVALRLLVEVLRRHSCDVPTELLSPSILGESVEVTRSEHALRIQPPPWAKLEREAVQSWTIPCP